MYLVTKCKTCGSTFRCQAFVHTTLGACMKFLKEYFYGFGPNLVFEKTAIIKNVKLSVRHSFGK